MKVTSDYDSSIDFNSYKSFKIVEVDPGESGLSELNLRRIVNAVNTEMNGKGFSLSDNPDIEVHLHGLVKDKVSADVRTDYYNLGYYRRGFGYGVTGNSTVDIDQYQEGTLVIDLVDAKSDELVWQGLGTARLNEEPKNREERINKAVAKILEGFPPMN